MRAKDHLAWYGMALVALLLLAPGVRATPIQEQRAKYRQALKALDAGRSGEFDLLRKQLRDSPLQPYLVSARLKRDLGKTRAAELRAFLTDHGDLPIADDLRRDWLRRLGHETKLPVFTRLISELQSRTTK